MRPIPRVEEEVRLESLDPEDRFSFPTDSEIYDLDSKDTEKGVAYTTAANDGATFIMPLDRIVQRVDVTGETYQDFIAAFERGLIKPGSIIFAGHQNQWFRSRPLTMKTPYEVVDKRKLRVYDLIDIGGQGTSFQYVKTEKLVDAMGVLNTLWRRTKGIEATQVYR